MPLFDSQSPLSSEVSALAALADRISECGAFQELSETTSAAEARPKVVIGPHILPFDGKEYTEDELAGMLCEAHIWIPVVEGGKQLAQSDATGERPRESGQIFLTIRRYCRPVESEDRNDLYLYLSDRISAFEADLWHRCDMISGGANCPILQSITRQDFGFSPHKTQSAQGEYFYAKFTVTWGDLSN